jgi:hypothetical protein
MVGVITPYARSGLWMSTSPARQSAIVHTNKILSGPSAKLTSPHDQCTAA